ncbi:beta/gamma crystallin domain-containing protein [Streptomyces sp. NPDC052042]|uniref:beta/gamma crystallin domain-containing protein n=1 Tax=Streptomyces sp. NPDC052042 TaxID=3365683 RepID=UPI0037D4B601
MAALVATTVPVAAASPPPAVGALINRTACNERGYLAIYNNDGRETLCSANAGSMPVAIYGVNWVESGNNVVTLEYQKDMNDPKLDTVNLQK